MHVKCLCDGREASAVHLGHPHVGIVQGLSDLRPNRFHFLAVRAPRSVEFDEPLSLLAHVQETVAKFQDTRTHGSVTDEEHNWKREMGWKRIEMIRRS